MKQLILTLTLLFNFTSFAQNVTIREYYSNIPGDIVNGDTIELSFDTNADDITVPLLIEVNTDSAFTIRYHLNKIESNECILSTLKILYSPDPFFESTCIAISNSTNGPLASTVAVNDPNSTTLILKPTFYFNCNACSHFRYYVYINDLLQDSVDFRVCGILGLNDDLNKLNSISIYPNPSSEFITIESGEDFSNKQVHVINNEGQIVLKNGIIQNNQLNISSFDQGSYFLLIYENEKLISKSPFVVIK